jgi:archaemetzincin
MPDPAICFLPLGPVPEEILTSVGTAVEQAFEQPTRILPVRELPLSCYDTHRDQYFSTGLIKKILKWAPRDALKVLGLTSVDLFIPVMKYLFGEAQVSGKGAIVSTFRLRPEFYGLAPDRDLYLERVAKEAVHELGHTFGLTHCRDPLCVMNSSCLIGETDCKGMELCATCQELYRWVQGKGSRFPGPEWIH